MEIRLLAVERCRTMSRRCSCASRYGRGLAVRRLHRRHLLRRPVAQVRLPDPGDGLDPAAGARVAPARRLFCFWLGAAYVKNGSRPD